MAPPGCIAGTLTILVLYMGLHACHPAESRLGRLLYSALPTLRIFVGTPAHSVPSQRYAGTLYKVHA